MENVTPQRLFEHFLRVEVEMEKLVVFLERIELGVRSAPPGYKLDEFLHRAAMELFVSNLAKLAVVAETQEVVLDTIMEHRDRLPSVEKWETLRGRVIARRRSLEEVVRRSANPHEKIFSSEISSIVSSTKTPIDEIVKSLLPGAE